MVITSSRCVVLPTGEIAPAAARAEVRDSCQGLLSVDLVTDAELVVSELVTNAVVHGREPVTVDLVVEEGLLVLGVHDEGTGFTELPPPAGPDDAGGRGLRLVGALVDTWLVQAPDRAGTGVWCVLSDPVTPSGA